MGMFTIESERARMAAAKAASPVAVGAPAPAAKPAELIGLVHVPSALSRAEKMALAAKAKK